MQRQVPPLSIIYTNQAGCRDCWRCVRVCPVKAIRVVRSQASVDPTRCIDCGTCVRECPQKAKTYRRDVDRAESLISAGKFVIASLAPSFAGVYEAWEHQRLPGALRRLGFKFVAETAIGAEHIANAMSTQPGVPGASQLTTACPAVVAYVEKYQPERVTQLMPLVSPMIAHGRHLKARFGEKAAVVFIGPCLAKKAEAERPELAGAIDAVITFEELDAWLSARGIALDRCEESEFDEQPGRRTRLYPLEGGALAAAGITTENAQETALVVTGFEGLREGLRAGTGPNQTRHIEPMFCSEGCINGPGIGRKGNRFERQAKVIRYAKSRPERPVEPLPPIPLNADYKGRPVRSEADLPSEDRIRTLFEQTGRGRVEDQLNCGACGYPSCRDQAIAVLLGMAEREMCIPYMRRLAEQRSDRILQTSPNGIAVLDADLTVVSVNAAFERLFQATNAVGQPISHFTDPDPFERLVSGQTELFEGEIHTAGSVPAVRLIAYGLPNEERWVAIFVSMGDPSADAKRLERLKAETVQRAKELYEQQIEMARQFATALGDHTAKGERLVQRLIEAASRADSGEET